MEDNSSPSVRDAVSAAMDAAEAGTLEHVDVPDTVIAEEKPAPMRARDETGKFAKTEAQPEQVSQAPTVRKPPTSWAKDHWQRWEKLDPELQEYIEKREGDYAKGVSTYKSQWDQAEPLIRAVQPHMQQLQQLGMRPEQFITELASADRLLRSGNPEQKLQAFYKLANDYGVNLQPLTGGQGDPQYGHLAQTVNTLQSRIQQWETQAQEAEQTRLNDTINSFAVDKPHFQTVRGTMGQLLQSGVASDLQSAYDKAIRLHDDVWSEQQAQQASSVNRSAELAKKRAAATPRSASPTGSKNVGTGDKDARSHVSQAWDAHMGGRI